MQPQRPSPARISQYDLDHNDDQQQLQHDEDVHGGHEASQKSEQDGSPSFLSEIAAEESGVLDCSGLLLSQHCTQLQPSSSPCPPPPATTGGEKMMKMTRALMTVPALAGPEVDGDESNVVYHNERESALPSHEEVDQHRNFSPSSDRERSDVEDVPGEPGVGGGMHGQSREKTTSPSSATSTKICNNSALVDTSAEMGAVVVAAGAAVDHDDHKKRLSAPLFFGHLGVAGAPRSSSCGNNRQASYGAAGGRLGTTAGAALQKVAHPQTPLTMSPLVLSPRPLPATSQILEEKRGNNKKPAASSAGVKFSLGLTPPALSLVGTPRPNWKEQGADEASAAVVNSENAAGKSAMLTQEGVGGYFENLASPFPTPRFGSTSRRNSSVLSFGSRSRLPFLPNCSGGKN
eukprot:g4414.t1